MLTAGLLLFALQGAADDAAAEARAALIEAESRVQAVVACTGTREDPAVDALRNRQAGLREEAIGLLPVIEPGAIDGDPPARCPRGDPDERLRLATTAVDRLNAASARRREAMRGLWVGPLRLCGSAVEEIGEGTSETGMRQVVARFSPAMAAVFAEETARRVTQRLAIVLDGRLLSAPTVNEPILGGVVVIAGGDPLEASGDELRAAAARPCGD